MDPNTNDGGAAPAVRPEPCPEKTYTLSFKRRHLRLAGFALLLIGAFMLGAASATSINSRGWRRNAASIEVPSMPSMPSIQFSIEESAPSARAYSGNTKDKAEIEEYLNERIKDIEKNIKNRGR